MGYETKKHIEEEVALMDKVASYWNAEAYKLGEYHRLDYALLRLNRVVAWVEVKCRKYAHNDFPDWMITMDKAVEAASLAERSGKPFIVIQSWTDNCWGWVKNPPLTDVRIGGRYDRSDPLDVRPHVYIPTSAFHLCHTSTLTQQLRIVTSSAR